MSIFTEAEKKLKIGVQTYVTVVIKLVPYLLLYKILRDSRRHDTNVLVLYDSPESGKRELGNLPPEVF